MDSIRIIITRNCDSSGIGGTVIDDAIGVLGSLPDGTPILDALAASFAEAYGMLMLPTGNTVKNEHGEEVPETVPAPYRNISYRMRLYGQDIVQAYAQNNAQKQAAKQAKQSIDAALGSVTVIDGKI